MKIIQPIIIVVLLISLALTYTTLKGETSYSASIVAIKDMLLNDMSTLQNENNELKVSNREMTTLYQENLQTIEENLQYLSGISYLKQLVFSSADEAIASMRIIIEEEKKRLPLGSPFGGENLFMLTAKYGESVLEGFYRIHKGYDIKNVSGDGTLYPLNDGVVDSIGFDRTYGKYIIIDMGNGYYSKYAHCSKIYYINGGDPVGQKVTIDTPIAVLGSTGKSTGPHTHLEILIRDEITGELKTIDPEYYIGKYRVKE